MNLETKRNSSRLCSRTISIQGTPGFSILSRLHGTLNSGDGAREAQPMIRYSRQLGTYVRGWGECSTSLGDQNMLYRKSFSCMDGAGAREWSG